jgi:hypothetical protein
MCDEHLRRLLRQDTKQRHGTVTCMVEMPRAIRLVPVRVTDLLSIAQAVQRGLINPGKR